MNNIKRFPCLKGRIGDWIYYVSLMSFKEISARTYLAQEIHKNEKLSNWIQREISDRSGDIVEYLKHQEQRFFNSLILGIHGGKPGWQEIDVNDSKTELSEEEKDYLSRTFGILTLTGDEKIFAIDGQHRVDAIKKLGKQSVAYNNEEVAVILIAHRNDAIGEVRTRRLFSTLNRYAKPVTLSEIIALDEDDNSAILTRNLMEDYDYLKSKILFSKTKSLSVNDKIHFTNIILLYEIIQIILTDISFSKNVKLEGDGLKEFTSKRYSEEVLNKYSDSLKVYFKMALDIIPSVKNFFITGTINRSSRNTSLVFRPIGQLIFFYVLKIAKITGQEKEAKAFFKLDDFNLANPIWQRVFLDSETQTIKTDKTRQAIAIHLICDIIGVETKRTKKEKELLISLTRTLE